MDRRDIVERSDHAARARLSRIVRDSEAGWLFYDTGGTAYHLMADEAALIERRGNRMIDKCNWMARELGRLPGKSLKLAMVVLCGGIVLQVALGGHVVDEDWIAGGFAAAVIFALFFAALHPLIAMVLRASVMLGWQSREAARLRRSGRGAVPAAIEAKHGRWNLFRILFTAALGVLAVRLCTMWFLTPSQIMGRGFAVETACLAVMGLTMIPARLIDLTHLRRKWLD